MKHLQIRTLTLILALSLSLGACQKKSTTNNRNNSPTSSENPDGVTTPSDQPSTDKLSVDPLAESADTPATTAAAGLTAPVSGSVTSSLDGVEAGSLQITSMGLFARFALVSAPSVQCSAGSFTVRLLGSGNAEPYLSKTTFSDSAFSIPNMPVSDEGVIEFTCDEGGAVRCLAKAGDSGILCNGVADSVLSSFEYALNKEILGADFKGKKVSKIAASIVEAARVASEEVDNFKDALTACQAQSDTNVKRLCYQTAIEKSPFNGAFQVMKQMVSSWTVEGLFSLVTDVYGLEIEMDNDLYSDLLGALDTSLGITFVADARNLIKNVVTAQLNKQGSYSFKITCAVEINGQKKYFDPSLNGQQIRCDPTEANAILATAGITLTAPQMSAFLAGELRSEVDCPTYTYKNMNDKCWLGLRIFAKATSTEADRNDISGTNRPMKYTRAVPMIDVMPQIMDALVAAGFSIQNGPQVNMNDPVQAQKIKEIMTNKKDYFTGLIGIYRFLNDNAISGTKLSLQDMHEIFTGSNFMNTRLVSWGPGMTSRQITTVNGNMYVPPILTYVPQNNAYKIADIFRWDYAGAIPTVADITNLVAASTPPFRDTFAMFQRIPNSKEVENFVFNSSHHEEWNPMGERFIYVAEFKRTGKPIGCKLVNAGPNFTLVSDTQVLCGSGLEYTNVTCTDGACTYPADFPYPFILFERGWYGENIGRMFALGGRKTGRELGMGNSRGIMVKEYKVGNPAGKCDNTQLSSVIEYIEEFWCGPDQKCEEKVRAYCMDMSAQGTLAIRRFYPGGMYKIDQYDPNSGQSSSWNVPMIGVFDGTDHKNDFPACLFVPTTGGVFTATGANGLATLNIDTTSGFVTTLAVGSTVKSCDATTAAGESKYRLFQWRDFANTATDNDMYAFVMDDQNQILQYKRNPDPSATWETTYLKISKAKIESILTAKTVANSVAASQINGMKFLNPLHDIKYDPYCDDEDGNGSCDCYPVNKILADGTVQHNLNMKKSNPQECGLMDKAAEFTISNLPYCPSCGAGTAQAENFLATFGGKWGVDLAGINALASGNSMPPMDLQRVVVCHYKFAGESMRRQPQFIDWQHWDGNHQGCPVAADAAFANNASGPIRIMSIKPMRNAFNIGRPKGMIKLMNYATKTVGQGTLVDPSEKMFSLDEVLALITLREILPPDNVKIFQVVNGTPRETKAIMGQFEPIERSGDHSSPFSQVLKAILYKSGKISLQDVTYQGQTSP